MPKRGLPKSFADAYAAVANDLQQRIGDAQAAMAGPPASVEPVPANDADRVRAWMTPHPEATDEAMMALAQQKLQEHTASGRSREDAVRMTAEDVTHARYPGRLLLYSLGTTTWSEQVKNARYLKRLAAKDGEDTEAVAEAPAPSPAAQTEQGGTTSGY
jgi:hypothetical protein